MTDQPGAPGAPDPSDPPEPATTAATPPEAPEGVTDRAAEPAAALLALRAATAGLLATLDAAVPADPGFAAAPSALPGWTRGHVLAHLAGNADSVARGVAGALAGEPVGSYPGGDAGRDAEIARRAPLPAAELAGLVRDSAQRLDRVFGAVADAGGWDLETGDRGPVGRCVLSRWREVEVHHADLAAGYSPADWPDVFVRWALADLAPRTLDPAGVGARVGADPALPDLVGTGYGPAGAARVVEAPGRVLVAWLLGRPVGAPEGGGDWPALPPFD